MFASLFTPPPPNNSLKYSGSASSWFGKLAGFLTVISLGFFSMTANAADCEPGERGTFNPSDGTFARDAVGPDYRVRCAGDQTDRVNIEKIIAAESHENADGKMDRIRYYVIDLDATDDQSEISLNLNRVVNLPEVFAITGDIKHSDDDRVLVGMSYDRDALTPIDSLRVESWANLETHGQGARAVALYDDAGDHAGRTVFVNRGSILTTGDHFIRPQERMYRNRRSDGAAVSLIKGDAEVINEVDATITTRGTGAKGIQVNVEGTGKATAVNRGTVRTEGEVFHNTDPDNSGLYSADGITASSENGDAEVRNEAGGSVATTGTGARGIRASVEGTGKATAVNHGTVTTTGDHYVVGPEDWRRAYGILAYSASGEAEATNERSGIVSTSGGVVASTDYDGRPAAAKKATAINRGMVTTRGGGAYGVGAFDGNTVNSESSPHPATIYALNEGTVTTLGKDATGVAAYGRMGHKVGELYHGYGTAVAENRGTITVSGDSAWVVGDPSTNGNDGSIGLEAGFYYGNNPPGNGGDATVINPGTVRSTGTRGIGLFVGTRGSGKASVRVENGIVEAGSASPAAKFGIGIHALANVGTTTADTNEDVDVEITVSDSTITAHSAAADDRDTAGYFPESSGVGIFGDTGSGATGHIRTRITGSTVTADTALRFRNGRATLALEHSKINGDIHFDPAGTVSMTTSGDRRVGGGSVNDRLNVVGTTINGDLYFGAGNDYMEVKGGIIEGALDFGAGDDNLNVVFEGGNFIGDIDFGAGNDHLRLDVGGNGVAILRGEVRGLESMNKQCPGWAIVGDVVFENSLLAIEEGGLLLRGHMNLGSEGTVTIHDKGLLAMEFGDIVNDPNDRGRLTAGGGVIYQSDATQKVDIQVRHDVTDQEAVNAKIKQGVILFEPGTEARALAADQTDPAQAAAVQKLTVTSGGTDVGTAEADGTATFNTVASIQQNEEREVPAVPATGASPTPPPVSSGGGGGGSGGAIAGVGLLAALLWWGTDADGSAFTDYEDIGPGYRQGVTVSAGLLPGQSDEYRVRIGDNEHWSRSWTDGSPGLTGAYAPAQGFAFGMDTYSDNGFKYGWGVMPSLSASAHGGPEKDFRTTLDGELFSVNGGWQGERYFANLNVLRGNYQVGSVVENPVVNSALSGAFNMSSDHAQLNAGAKFDFAGARLSPSVSLFAGSQKQDAWTASGRVMRAEIPAISQRYTGWKLGMNLTSSDWIQGSGRMSWRPALHLMTMGTDTRGPSSVNMQQSDRLGALDFASQAEVRELPGRVNLFGASVLVKRSDQSNFRIGYAGMEIDGEYQHAVMARYRYQF